MQRTFRLLDSNTSKFTEHNLSLFMYTSLWQPMDYENGANSNRIFNMKVTAV